MSSWSKAKESVPQREAPVNEPAGMEAVEQAFNDQLDDALVAFKEKRETEKKRFGDVIDTNYYFVVCFTSNEQMLEFCDKFGLDKDYKYYDGRTIARKFNKALETADMKAPREKGISKEYAERAM